MGDIVIMCSAGSSVGCISNFLNKCNKIMLGESLVNITSGLIEIDFSLMAIFTWYFPIIGSGGRYFSVILQLLIHATI
jgi:hypothetical protein